MSSLQDLMGSAYNDGMSIDEVKAFFEGNDKIVNLNNGGYVAKNKFDETNNKYKELMESTKDYADIKGKYDELVAKNEKDGQLGTIKKYVSPEYAEFVHYALKNGNKIDDKFEENIKAYVEANKQYALKAETPENPRVVKTYNEMDGEGKMQTAKETFNNMIRGVAGR